MRRTPNILFVALLAVFTAVIAVSGHAATPTGTITFSGHITDPNTPFPPGSVVNVHGAVVARSDTCIEARVPRPQSPRGAMLWLCSRDTQSAHSLPDVGLAINARARITRVEASAAGDVPYSDSFVLLRAD